MTTTQRLRDRAIAAREAMTRANAELQRAHDEMCAFAKEIGSLVPSTETLKHARVDASKATEEIERILRMMER